MLILFISCDVYVWGHNQEYLWFTKGSVLIDYCRPSQGSILDAYDGFGSTVCKATAWTTAVLSTVLSLGLALLFFKLESSHLPWKFFKFYVVLCVYVLLSWPLESDGGRHLWGPFPSRVLFIFPSMYLIDSDLIQGL